MATSAGLRDFGSRGHLGDGVQSPRALFGHYQVSAPWFGALQAIFTPIVGRGTVSVNVAQYSQRVLARDQDDRDAGQGLLVLVQYFEGNLAAANGVLYATASN